MGDRIRQLEDALALLHASTSKEPHPLLSEKAMAVDGENLDDKLQDSEDEGTGQVSRALGTLSVSDRGLSRFFGSTGGSDLLLVCCVLEGFLFFFLQITELSFRLTMKIRRGPLPRKRTRVTAQRGPICPLSFSAFPMHSHLPQWGP